MRRLYRGKSKLTQSKVVRMLAVEFLPDSGKPVLHRSKQLSQKRNRSGGASALHRPIPARVAPCTACPFDWLFPRRRSRCRDPATGVLHRWLKGVFLRTASFFALAVVAILTFIQPVSVAAQAELPEEVLRDVERNAPITDQSDAQPNLPPAPLRQSLKVRVVDKKFVAAMASLGGSEALRFTTHKLVLDHEYAAGAPWVTNVPSNQQFVAKYAAIYAAELLVTYELKKAHSWLPGDREFRKFWFAYPGVMETIHVKNGIRSIRTPAPGGCSAAECELQ